MNPRDVGVWKKSVDSTVNQEYYIRTLDNKIIIIHKKGLFTPS